MVFYAKSNILSSLIYCPTTSFILAHINFYLDTSRDLGQKKKQ